LKRNLVNLSGGRERRRGNPGCGVPHSDEPEESMKVELWVGGHPKRVEPSDMDPMKGDPEGDEAKGRRLDQKYQAQ